MVDDITTAAARAQKIRTEEGTIEEKPVGEIIDADRYVASKSASGAVPWGLRFAISKPGGTISNHSD
tara:strand:- start:13986 stop:14186 length:201 start_codon:yes stop_codon:yes gene_type:complete